jgi:hypothetical protein
MRDQNRLTIYWILITHNQQVKQPDQHFEESKWKEIYEMPFK